ncbi:hypothetical protein [Myroides sp. TSA_177.3]|uniref:hypothetical protein n=1 Tax=Myroides sp. TSA_177.3 TaxID=3415650 RepID=UPI004046760F
MKNIFFFMASIVFMTSCSNEHEVESNNSNLVNQTSVNDESPSDYKDFQLAGGPAKGWYDSVKGDCSGNGSACADTTVIVTRPKLEELIERLEQNPQEVVDLFTRYKEVALETFDPKLVEGTIDAFFSIRIDFNKGTNTKYVRFYRIIDDMDVGVYPIQM